MLTVPEAAKRSGRNPETIRRWIRAGRLSAHRVGTQHVIDEQDLDRLTTELRDVLVPEGWRTFSDGTSQPDWERMIRRSRDGALSARRRCQHRHTGA